MIIKLLIYGFAFYYLYRFVLKPMFLKAAPPEEEQPKMRFTNKKNPQKQANEEDYIDYEEVD